MNIRSSYCFLVSIGSPILRFLSASEQSRNAANRSTLVLIAGQRREQEDRGGCALIQQQHVDDIARFGGGGVHAADDQTVGLCKDLLHRGILQRERLGGKNTIGPGDARANVILSPAIGFQR